MMVRLITIHRAGSDGHLAGAETAFRAAIKVRQVPLALTFAAAELSNVA